MSQEIRRFVSGRQTPTLALAFIGKIRKIELFLQFNILFYSAATNIQFGASMKVQMVATPQQAHATPPLVSGHTKGSFP